MAIIRPFKAIRPNTKFAEQVASKPYDVLSTEEARTEAKDNDYSFLRIIKPEINFPEQSKFDQNVVFAKAKDVFDNFLKSGVFEQENQDCFYLYRLIMGDTEQSGLVCLSSVADYENDIIKKHEFTRPAKEQDRIQHVLQTGIQSGPVFLTYKANKKVSELTAPVKEQAPLYDFTADDGVKHSIWKIDNAEIVNKIREAFEAVPATYIADGHHRAAASAKAGIELRKENKNHNGDEPYNYFLSVLFPSSELKILDYNRVVQDLNGLSTEEFLSKLAEYFSVIKIGSSPYKPSKEKSFGLFIDRNWYKLSAKEGTYEANHPVHSLDPYILQENVFRKLLGIEDVRTDDRVDFVGGIRGLGELEKRVNTGEWKAAFALYPVSIEQLMQVADSGNVMPPKSTWFEPKLRSGLLINKIR
ncbi:MAG: DUF1015 family protein [Chitinophagales bacterium]